MSKVLAINAGSSSLKFQLFEMPAAQVLASGVIERIGLSDSIFTIKFSDQKQTATLDINNHEFAAELVLKGLVENKIVDNLNSIIAVGHRAVHGGESYNESVLVTDEVVSKFDELSELAPLHNPANLVGYRAFKHALPEATHTFSFDTAFHQTMKPEVFLYPLPYEFYTDLQVRRYGMHGISHEYVSKRTAELMERDAEGFNVIVLHLGNGASISAVKDGKCIDTSMGFTPLAGIMMGTRSGDVDPAIITYLMRKLGKSAEEIVDIYNKQSGMLGISGLSSDARDIQDAIENGDERAILTRKLYAQRILQVVGSYVLELGRVDALAFTAGLGENDVQTRKAILDLLKEGLGLSINEEINNTTRGTEVALSYEDSKVAVWIVPTNEELMIAKDAFRIHNEG